MENILPAAWLVSANCLMSVSVASEVLMDQVNLRGYDTLTGNAIGGDDLFGGGCFALELSDDFRTTSTAYIVTEVQVANIFLEGPHQVSDARVSVYPDLGGMPGEEAVYSERVSGMRPGPATVRPRVTNEEFDDHVGNLSGVLTTITGLWIPLEPDTGYYICIQVDAGPDNWAYTALDEDEITGSDCYFRDGPPEEGCQGDYGNTTWEAMGSRWNPANVNYRVVAISRPPPRPDLDGDGSVTAADVAAFLAAWCAGQGDVDGDGDSDAADVVGFVSGWAEESSKATKQQGSKSEKDG